MFSFSPSKPSIFKNFLMFSILLLSFSVPQVLSQSPITNIGVLGNYFGGATGFIRNRPFFYQSQSMVVPKSPLQHSSPLHYHHNPYHPHRHRPHHYPHFRPKSHPPYPHFDPLPRRPPLAQHPSHPWASPHPLSSPLMLSPLQSPVYDIPNAPVIHSLILPENDENMAKPKKKKSKSKSKSHKRRHHKHKHKSYPKSINDKLENIDFEDPDDDPHWNHDLPEYDNHYEEPPSYYEQMPPFDKPKRPVMQTLKDKQKAEIAKNKTKNKTKNGLKNQLQKSQPEKNGKRPKNEYENNGWTAKYNDSNHKSSPRYSDRIRKPILSHDPQNTGIDVSQNKPYNDSNDKRKEKEKKDNNYRTATANQLSHKEEEEKDGNQVNEPDFDRDLEGVKGEDLKINDDPKTYPHQYAIEIRWKGKNPQEMEMDEPEDDRDSGDREMHSSKDLDHARNRKYKHEEEEHWHEKDWINEGLRKAYLKGKPVPVTILQPNGFKMDGVQPDFGQMPLYAQPMPTGATLDQINQHFAIPTPNFRVNNRFMEWAKNAIDLNGLQNNYITLYRR